MSGSPDAGIRCVHIVGSKTLGGAERFYLRLVESLHARGQPVTAVLRRGSEVVAQVPRGIPVVESPMRTVWDPFSRRAITKTLAALEPQIVQTYMGRATRLTHAPKPGPVHVARLGGFYKLDGYRHADAWVGNTQAICAYLRDNGFPAERVFYIPNFVEAPPPVPATQREALRDTLGVPRAARVIVGVGRLIEKKGFRHLLEAFARLPAQLDERPLHLVIVGDGGLLQPLQAQARELGIGARVHWAGWQTEPGPYYALADVFVCPSLHEPLGNVILEAWSHAVPVLSTDTHGARELIQEGVDGAVVPCADAPAMATRLLELLQDTDTNGLGLAGREKVLIRFGRDAVVDMYLDLYKQLLARR